MIETQFINYILDSKDKDLVTKNNITEDYFFEEGCKLGWNYILTHIRLYDSVPDKVTFLAEFPNFDALEVDEPPEYLLKELIDSYKTNLVTTSVGPKGAVGKAVAESNVDDLVVAVTNVADELNRVKVIESVDLLEDTSRYNDYLDRLENPKKYCVGTGMKHLDIVLGGGWDRKEELATIVARSGVGKSWLAIQFAVAAAKEGLNVGIYSGEMSENKVGYRVDTFLGNERGQINLLNGDLMHGNINSKDNYKEYIEGLKGKVSGHIRVLTPTKIGGPAGVGALRAFIEKDSLDMLIVDQHSLLEDDRKAKSPIERASNISKDLKNLQVMKKIPIIAVSQQNRTSVENGVGTEHVAQSDRIAQDSTTILFLERDKQKKNRLIINVGKSRDNISGVSLTYEMDFNTGQHKYIPEGDDVDTELYEQYYGTSANDTEVNIYDDDDGEIFQ